MINLKNLEQELALADDVIRDKVQRAGREFGTHEERMQFYAFTQLQVLEAIHERLGSVIMAQGLTR